MRYEEILVALTIGCGIVWLIDFLFLSSRRATKTGISSSKREAPFYIEYPRSAFPLLLLVLALRSFFMEPFRIPSSSMKPTLLEGDFIVVNKFKYGIRLPIMRNQIIKNAKPERGDVVVFFHHKEKRDLIKRIVGKPGDFISYRDKKLYINGKLQEQTFLRRDTYIGDEGITWPVSVFTEQLENKQHPIYISKLVNREPVFNDLTVPPNHYFVMGDNRDNSKDSRFWGFVHEKDILGPAKLTWLSWDKKNKDIRWERFGKPIK